jgi:hypothetical protein
MHLVIQNEHTYPNGLPIAYTYISLRGLLRTVNGPGGIVHRVTTYDRDCTRARPGGINPVAWTARIFPRSRPKILTTLITKPTHSHLTADPHVSSLLQLEPSTRQTRRPPQRTGDQTAEKTGLAPRQKP